MSDTDTNGFPIKPGHSGVSSPPFGPKVWVLERYDGKIYGVWTSRHDAVAARTTRLSATCKREWLTPRLVPVGSLRLEDLVVISPEEGV